MSGLLPEPFDPVPVRPRHDGWTPERQRGFIDRLTVTGSVARSARAVGMSPQSADTLRKHAQAASFARAWEQALANGRSFQRDVAIRRSLEGETIPIVYKGKLLGQRVRHDNRLAVAVLDATPRRELPAEADPAADLQRAIEALTLPPPPPPPPSPPPPPAGNRKSRRKAARRRH
ncbi:MAG TPA: hypothetical protein VGB79_13025 [Allosphingosinicella sp.]|jgi:hypothetical protein